MSTVNESIWNDIRRRGNGSDVKKEDDVNLLDIDGLYDYIKSKYEKYVFYLDKDTFGILNKRNIVVDIISNVSLFTSYDKSGKLDHILLSWTKVKIGMPFFDKLSERFNVQSPNVCRRRITEKDGTCTNQTYIDVIDFFLKNMDNMLVNESIWNDIRKRGIGDNVKQEEFTEEFIDKVKSDLISFTMSVVNYIENYELTFDGFYKYLEEIENPDEIKKIIYYVKTHKDECDKLLEKDIKFENKLLDEKVNVYLLRFVDNIVYDEKYHNTLSDIKKFASEIFKGHKSSYDFHINKKLVFKDKSELFNDYIEDKWKDGSLKQKIDDLIKNENDEISKYGFVKEPGKTISETVDDWWYSLDEDKRNDLGWDEFGDDAEEEYYTDHNPEYNEYTGEDFEADEWWDDAYGIRKVKIYCSEHSKANESIWNDIRRRGNGTDVKKEDEMTQDDLDALNDFIFGFATRVVWDGVRDSLTNFLKYIDENPEALDCDIDRVKKYVEDNWHKSICDDVEAAIEQEDKEKEEGMNESIWNDIRKRGNGTEVKKEDDIELLDMTGLYDYILAHYELTDKNGEMTYGSKNMCITISSEGDEILLSYVSHAVYLFFELRKYELLDTELCKKFNVTPAGNNIEQYIVEQGGEYTEYTNQFFIDVLNCIIANRDTILRKKDNVSESIWNDIRRRGNGTDVKKEDEMTSDDYRNLKEVLKMFGREVRFFGDHKNQNFFPVKVKKYKITLEDCLYYIDVLVDSKFTGADFPKLKRYIEVNWEQDPMIKNIIQWTVDGKNSKEIDQEIRNASKSDEFWDLNECDGVPGGITPADIGGMGPAYFPGPNGEPGSGDLPSPTGIVYKQVAPFDTFIKMRRPKKNKKKKFRKEDEPCVHSKNPPIYSYVDDFRDYVDRTYNNIDKRK